MKDILKIMRFDLLTAKPLALAGFIVTAVMCFSLSLFFAPLINSYITFGAMIFVIPLQSVADKSGFNKLYGVLPVKRGNITRARFLYIFLVHFICEVIEIAFALIAFTLKLNRLLPDDNAALREFIGDAFSDKVNCFTMIVAVFLILCLLFAYMEMMGQIFGRENEMKIILITLAVLTVVLVAFFMLSERDIIPTFKLPELPSTAEERIKLGIALNIVMFALCVIFGEITASKLAKREL